MPLSLSGTNKVFMEITMKIRGLFAAAAVIFMLQARHSIAANGASLTEEEHAGTTVKALAEPVYSFAKPPDSTIVFPDTETVIGDFEVREVFIESDEWLTVSVIPGEMTGTAGSGLRLSYEVHWNPPAAIDQSNKGDRYSVTVKIDKDDFSRAAKGSYVVPLLFRVTSYPKGKVVWEGTAVVTAVKPDDTSPRSPDTSNIVNWCIIALAAMMLVLLWLLRPPAAVRAGRKIKSKKLIG